MNLDAPSVQATARGASPTTKRVISALPLLIILLAAAGLRLWAIGRIPPGFHFDESFEGLEALRILGDANYRPIFLTGNFGVPPLNAYANAIAFALARAWGGQPGPTIMRATAALFGWLGALFVYLLARELQRLDDRIPAAAPEFAAAGLALMRWHIHFSRMGIEPILVPTLWAAGFWLLLRGWRKGGWPSFALAGLVFAASFYTYQAAWVLPGLAALVTLHLFIHDRARGRERWRGLVLAAGVVAMVVAPLAWFFWRHPSLLFLRPSQIAAVGADPAASGSIWQNMVASAAMYLPWGQFGDMDPRRNIPGFPALNLWQALPFFLGLAASLRWIRRPAFALPVISLIVLLLPGVITEYAPHFHRILGAAGPTALLIGLGLGLLVGWLKATLSRLGLTPNAARRVGSLLALLLLLLGGVVAARNYFVRWAAMPDLFYAFDQGLWEIGRWIAQQPASARIHLSPRDAEHPTLAFAWTLADRPAPLTFDGRHIMPAALQPDDQPDYYIIIEHEDDRSRLLLPQLFEDLVIVSEQNDDWGRVYSRIYARPPAAALMRKPQHPFSAIIGDGVRFDGYDIAPDPPQPGRILYLQLYWRVDSTPTRDWTVFTHVLGPPKADGDIVWAGFDSKPGLGSLPTPRWPADYLILDEYQIPLPPDLPPGPYTLEIGFYLPDGRRLPADGLRIGEVKIGD